MIKTRKITISDRVAACPSCSYESYRHSIRKRVVLDVFMTYLITYSYHRCPQCKSFFNNPKLLSYAGSNGKWGVGIKKLALVLQKADTVILEDQSKRLKEQTGFYVHPTVIHDWLTAAGLEVEDVDQDIDDGGQHPPEFPVGQAAALVGEASSEILQEASRAGEAPPGLPEGG